MESPERVRERAKKWADQNPERVRTRVATWVKENPDRVAAYRKMYYEKNKERIKARSNNFYSENKEIGKERTRNWRLANWGKYLVQSQNRRAKKRQNGGTLSKNIREKLFSLQKGKCACCGISLGKDYDLDHIVPLSLGGPNDDNNMQLLTRKCNNKKAAKHPIDYMQSKGFLL